jgi:hypothetical protein
MLVQDNHEPELGESRDNGGLTILRASTNSPELQHAPRSTCKRFVRHWAFFLGSLLATVASLLDLRDALFSTSDDNDNDSDAWVLSFWSVQKILWVASCLAYLLDSVNACEEISSKRNLFRRLAFPVIFGVAASCELLGEIVPGQPKASYWWLASSVHLFFASSLLTVYVNHTTGVYFEQHHGQDGSAVSGCRCRGINGLLLMGDCLFVVGSLVDVCVSYWDSPYGEPTSWVWIASWSVVSSLLWWIDSILYRLADHFENGDSFLYISHLDHASGVVADFDHREEGRERLLEDDAIERDDIEVIGNESLSVI